MASRDMYFQHLPALNSTGISQVLLLKSPCVLTNDGVISAIPARRISNDAKDDHSMKTVGVHIVAPLFCVRGRGWVKIYSQFIAVCRKALQSLTTRVITAFQADFCQYPSSATTSGIAHRIESRKARSKKGQPSNKGRSIAMHWKQQIRIEIPAR